MAEGRRKEEHMFNRETFRTWGPTIEVKYTEERQDTENPSKQHIIVRGGRDRIAGNALCWSLDGARG